MKDFQLVYDEISFREEYKEAIQPYNGEFDNITTLSNVTIWTYPNSSIIADTNETLEKDEFEITDTYTDINGQLWVYILLYGHSDGWIKYDKNVFQTTISTQIPVTQSPKTPIPNPQTQAVNTQTPQPDISTQPTQTQTFETQMPVKPFQKEPNSQNVIIILIGLVAFVMAVTAILIRIFLKKKI